MPRRFHLLPDNPREIERQAGIVRYLMQEPRVAFFVRQNSGATQRHSTIVWFYKLFIRGGEARNGKGISDLYGLLKDGRFFALEVKVPGKITTPDQAVFLRTVAEHGGISGVVEDWQQAKQLIAGRPQDGGS